MLDLPIIDPHHHLWQLQRSYPWLEGRADPNRFTGDDSAIRVDYLPADYERDFAGLDLRGSVHIDAGAGDALQEARWVQELQESVGVPTAAVAGADLLAPRAGEHLEALAELSTVRGVRHILNWHADANFTYTDRPHIMADSAWLANFSRLEALGFSFDLQVYPAQLTEAADLARAHPGTPIILNHTGMPTGVDSESFDLWRAGIDALAALPNTTVKVSGLGMTIHPWSVEILRPFVQHTIEAFGPDRAMFASNFPVDRLYSDLATLYSAFDELSASYSEDERRALFAETAVRVYRLPPLPSSSRKVSPS